MSPGDRYRRVRSVGRCALALATWALVGVAPAPPAAGQIALEPLEECSVQVLNVSVKVQQDGAWELPNVPANGGQVRVRLNCVQGSNVRVGQSDYFVIQPNMVNAIPKIPFGDEDPGPTSLTAILTKDLLTGAGETTALTIVGLYPDGSEQNITLGSKGTSYQTSNPATITVTEDGLLTAQQSGTVVIGAWNEGVTVAIWVQAKIGEDSDDDGLPDDYENAVGLDANDPLDALIDHDKDNLINLKEFQYGTDPFLADTDGDGIDDGEEAVEGEDGWITNPVLADGDGDLLNDKLELLTGTDPNDPASFDFDAALLGLEVKPQSVILVFNPIIGEASVQLQVVGLALDGTGIDLTQSPWLSYISSDLTIASFGATAGEVFAGQEGSTSILVTIAGHATTVPVLVKSFSPQGLAALQLDCYGNDVALGGSRALVACGAAGLHVVDVDDPADPWITGTLDTPGNANGVATNGVTLWLADGDNGLVTATIDAAGVPTTKSTLDLGEGADAWELAISGGRALVAAGQAGLFVVDVSNPVAPLQLGHLPLVGFARDVAVAPNKVAAVSLTGGTIALVDVSNPGAPLLLSTTQSGGQTSFGVTMREDRLFVATGNTGMSVIDITSPLNPQVTATLGSGDFMLTDLIVQGGLLFGADYYRVNSVPIVQVTLPDQPLFVGVVEFSQFNDANGIAIDADSTLVAMTGTVGGINADKLSSGQSYLFVGQYDDLSDPFGIPPTCVITSPEDASLVTSGAKLPVMVSAIDDVFVEEVRLYLDGELATTDKLAPFKAKVKLPTDLEVHTISAEAMDPGGNVGTCDPVVISLIPDPLTTVIGTVVDSEGLPILGAQVYIVGIDAALGVETGPDGTFELPGAPTWEELTVGAVGIVGSDLLMDHFGPFPPVYGGFTNVGTLTLQTPIGSLFGGPIVSQMISFQGVPAGTMGSGTLAIGTLASPLVTFNGATGAGDGVLTLGTVASPMLTFLGVSGAQGDGVLTLGTLASPLVTFAGVTGGGDGVLTMGVIASPLVTFGGVAGAAGDGVLTLGPLASPIITFGGTLALGGGTQLLGPIVSALLTFTDRPIVTNVDPATASIAAGTATLTIAGYGLAGATEVQLFDGDLLDDELVVSDLIDSPEGLTSTLTIPPTTAPGPRTVVVVTDAGASLADATADNTLELVP